LNVASQTQLAGMISRFPVRAGTRLLVCLLVAYICASALVPTSASGSPSTAPVGESAILAEAIAQVDAAAPSSLAPSTSATIDGGALQPALDDEGEELDSSGTLTSSSVSKERTGEVALETSEGEVAIRPTGLIAAPGAPALVDGVAALFGDESTQVVVRPTPLGTQSTVLLDGAESPQSLRWEVGLSAREHLVELAGGEVAIVTDRLHAAWQAPPPREALDLSISDLSSQARGPTSSLASSTGAPLPPAAALTAPAAPAKAGELQPQQTAAIDAAQSAQIAEAEADTGGAAVMVLGPLDATDAAGRSVPSTLNIEGNDITATLSPPDANYPLIATLPMAAPSDPLDAERHTPTYGVADDRPSAFGAGYPPELSEGPLHTEVARLVIPYDVALTGGPELTRLREWLHAVGEARGPGGRPLRPYVTLWSEACLDHDGEDCAAPPAERYREAVYTLMSEYARGEPAEGLPPVRMWGAWNEPNDSPAQLLPSTAAELWETAQSVASLQDCGCEVAAAEFAGYPAVYAAQYKSFMLEHGLRPAVWGMHDYGDLIEVPSGAEAPLDEYVNERLRQFVELTATRLGKPSIWLSEQGVELENTGEQTRLDGNAELQQLAAEDFLRLSGESTRIALVDYYMLNGPEAFLEAATGVVRAHPEAEGVPVFDSSLLTEAGTPLPAFCVLGYEDHACP
jgi:hypothetical protein